jgi:hypothetical protein
VDTQYRHKCGTTTFAVNVGSYLGQLGMRALLQELKVDLCVIEGGKFVSGSRVQEVIKGFNSQLLSIAQWRMVHLSA